MKKQINRKQYQTIRKMDHSQMESYLQKIYDEGYEEGKKAAEKEMYTPALPEVTELKAVLQEVKGIGEVKAIALAEKVIQFISRGEIKE